MAFFKVSYNDHKCKNCGHVQLIQTNHDMGCIDYCRNCSWKPSFGEHKIDFCGRAYRPFEFVKKD